MQTKVFYSLLLVSFQFYFIAPFGYALSGIELNLDAAHFQDPNHQSYLEIYYSIPEKSVSYIPNDAGKYACQIVLDLQIYQDKSLWSSKIWRIEKSFQDTTQINQNSHLVDVIRYIIDKPASYRIIIHAKDLNQPALVDSITTVIDCPIFPSEKLEISDVELASNIARATPGSTGVFVKNVYEIVPNPSGLYGEGTAAVFYYFEVYNLLNNIPGKIYKTLSLIKDSNGNIVKGISSANRTKKKVHNTSVEMGKIDIANIPSGKYTLVYGIMDSTENVLKKKEKPFFVFNPSVSADELETVTESVAGENFGPLQVLSEKELDEEFERMIYITKDSDRKFYKTLTNADAKRKFIFSIWQTPRITSPMFTGMPYRENYISRIQKADATFSSVFKSGWKSDRGRVFILYGAPSNVERFPSTQTSLPYEIWTYDHLQGQGAVIFVFSDQTGFNKYQLIHSTLRGELQEPEWQRLITRGTGEFQRPIEQ
jgi:GWxTD domain-containing protein